MYCPKCGNELEGGEKFCAKCGASLLDLDNVVEHAPKEQKQQDFSRDPLNPHADGIKPKKHAKEINGVDGEVDGSRETIVDDHINDECATQKEESSDAKNHSIKEFAFFASFVEKFADIVKQTKKFYSKTIQPKLVTGFNDLKNTDWNTKKEGLKKHAVEFYHNDKKMRITLMVLAIMSVLLFFIFKAGFSASFWWYLVCISVLVFAFYYQKFLSADKFPMKTRFLMVTMLSLILILAGPGKNQGNSEYSGDDNSEYAGDNNLGESLESRFYSYAIQNGNVFCAGIRRLEDIDLTILFFPDDKTSGTATIVEFVQNDLKNEDFRTFFPDNTRLYKYSIKDHEVQLYGGRYAFGGVVEEMRLRILEGSGIYLEGYFRNLKLTFSQKYVPKINKERWRHGNDL
ncbi:MAG: zinc-ribbon domain-containing protein [Bacteroidaceae bacterium]|nr:zinc-ribbon domain-containing protein [Bacteroidaceae bacterium]